MVYTIQKGPFTFHSFIGGYDKNITYLIQTPETERVWAIDASVPIGNLPGELKNRIAGIFITHTHGDHVAYLDQFISENPEIDIYLFGGSSYKMFDKKTTSISDGDIINIDQFPVKVLHTPGHYPDSCCFLFNDSLFTGDTVFIGRTGRTISAGSNVRTLYHSVYKKVLTLPQDVTLFPGHDYGSKPYCSIEENIKLSPLLRAENEDDFVFRMEEYERSRIS